MADALTEILATQQRNQNAALQQASHTASWSNTFQDTPSSEKLRANNNLNDLVATAIEQKQRLLAQADAKAAAAYVAQKKLEEYQRQAPTREKLLNAKVDHEIAATAAIGAHDRFVAAKDTQAMNDVAALADAAASMKSNPGTPEHLQEITDLIASHPYALTTKAGSELVSRLSKTHNDISSTTPPPGTVLDHFTVDDSGKQVAHFKPAPATKADPQSVFEDALANSTPVYGTSTNGKDFTPGGEGRVDQTHVQTRYVLPSGKLSPLVIYPRSLFDNAVANSRARNGNPVAAAPIPGLADAELERNNPPASTGATPTVDPNDDSTPPVAPASAPHPYEGMRVLQKSTGQYGTFTNGQFVPEAQ